MAEPRLVVAHREGLWWLLAEAARLEHMIMCQYLFADFGLERAVDEGLTREQAEALARWSETLHRIAVEEMLRLALVANLMSAIGAAPTFGRPNFPQRSGSFPAAVRLDLLPFGERALRHFLYLERPEGTERLDAEGFVPVAPPFEPLAADEAMPRGQEFATVGHRYRGIAVAVLVSNLERVPRRQSAGSPGQGDASRAASHHARWSVRRSVPRRRWRGRPRVRG